MHADVVYINDNRTLRFFYLEVHQTKNLESNLLKAVVVVVAVLIVIIFLLALIIAMKRRSGKIHFGLKQYNYYICDMVNVPCTSV